MPLLENPVGRGVMPVLNSLNGGQMPTADWVRLRQPYLSRNGQTCVAITDLDGRYTVNDSRGGERKPLLTAYRVIDLVNRGLVQPRLLLNAAMMPKEGWIELDRAILRAARPELRFAADIEAASTYGGFNGMAKMTIEYQAMSDPGEAVVDMDGRTDGRNDAPLFILRSMPLPITHSDFGYSDRELQVNRSAGMPFDTTLAEAGARRVSEVVEDTAIGNVTGVTYGTQTAGAGTHTGTSTVYGARNFPQRLTKSNFTAPTGVGWVPDTTYNEVLLALQQLAAQNFHGPFVMYYSTDWDPYMNRVYSVSGGNTPGETLLTMLKKHPKIQDVRYLPRLTATFTFLFVQMTSNVVQMVNGMDITTIQYDEKGGLDHRMKIMTIKAPRWFSDYNSQTGVLHGTAA